MRSIFRRLEAIRRDEERLELEVKKRRRLDFRHACKVAISIAGTPNEHAIYALAYLGSQAGFAWPEVKKMLGDK